jgi:hypothetical protein
MCNGCLTAGPSLAALILLGVGGAFLLLTLVQIATTVNLRAPSLWRCSRGSSGLR